MKNYDLIVIGGGAAGLFASCVATSINSELSVCVLEKMERCGRKIALTGKGRCNLTNTKPWQEFSTHIHPNNTFIKSAFYNMPNLKTMEFFESMGLSLVTERGDRVYPKSMRAMDVTDTMLDFLSGKKVTIKNSAVVKSIVKEGDLFVVTCGNGMSVCGKCAIIATGGLSYPTTGSTGDGYEFAKGFGHSITPRFPSLTALVPNNYKEDFYGISLKNVSLKLLVNSNVVCSEFGDLDFTNGGIEGPIGFKISRKAVYNLINGQKVSVVLDLKPAVEAEQIASRIKREIASNNKYSNIRNLLSLLLPQRLIPLFMEYNKDLSINNLPEHLKNWNFKINSFVGYQRCVVTAGGVSVKEVSMKTMESKLVEDLYFAGEVLDVDGDTGGYNLQIAFSTAALAAKSAVQKISGVK